MLHKIFFIFNFSLFVFGDAKRKLVEDEGPPFDKLRFRLPVFPEQFTGTLYDSAELKTIEDHEETVE